MSQTELRDERQILRQAIDASDSEILKILAERRRLVEALGALKAGEYSPVRDTDRERAVIERAVAKGREYGLSDSFVETLFQAIIDDSLRRQRAGLDARVGDAMLTEARVAYLGGPGSYSQFAANAHFSGRYSGVAPVIKRDYAAIFKALEEGEADYGFLPIENTATGGVNEVYDLLRDTNLKIAGEHHMKIQHALMGKASDLGPVRTVYGHPQALRQAQRWLNSRMDLKKVPVTSTTRALERALDEGPEVAAVAGPDAARLFGLNLIEPMISDFEGNETRFVALAVDPAPASPLLPCKTSLVFITSDASGSLVDALDGFRQHGVNMTKLESRPVPGSPWEQMFFLDLEGHEEDKTVAKALEHLSGCAKSVRRFGSYGSDRLKPTSLEG
ncbi:bifunctional chorismate mutase/prephenate dehydratase [Oceanicaulis sp.]|uniref:bifunctional chorismate mutase/prephenate dehydratase n=1 Tax=Oceanicaulis sp. TaxID=1924941 RepID=UPI003BA890C7